MKGTSSPSTRATGSSSGATNSARTCTARRRSRPCSTVASSLSSRLERRSRRGRCPTSRARPPSSDRKSLRFPRRRLGGADDERTDERRRLRELISLERGDPEAGCPDGVDGRAVAVAAVGHDPVQAVHPILPLSQARLVRSHVLEKEQPAAWFQNAP